MNTVCKLSVVAALLLAPFVQNRVGAIEGVVVSTVDGAPISKAAVTLNSIRSGSLKTITDHEGRFAFRDLPAGQFGIKVSRMGYFAPGFSDKDVTLTIAERQELKGVQLRLRPGGAISGRITDADGDPLTNVTIEALQYSFQDSQLALTTAKFAVALTDDRGEYRIFWLAPGRYYIRAVGIAPGRGVVLTPTNNAAYLAEETYAPIYFPGTSNADTATAIDLRPGQEYDGADFRLLAVRTHHIRGVVTDAAKGIPAAGASVSLLPLTSSLPSDSRGVRTNANGEFDLPGVPPGSYILNAGSNNSADGARLAARTVMEVGDMDVDRLALVLAPGIELSGRILVDGTRTNTTAAHPVIVLAQKNNLPASQRVYDGADFQGSASFTIHDVVEGDYELQFFNMEPGEYVKAIRFGSVDVLNGGLHVDYRTSDRLDVVLGMNAPSLDGVVVNEKREPEIEVPVLLVPVNVRLRRADPQRHATTDAFGRFRFQDVPPGDYLLFAWDHIENGTWQDPAFVSQIQARGKPIHLEEGGAISVELPALY